MPNREDPVAFISGQAPVLRLALVWRKLCAVLLVSSAGCGSGDGPTRQEEVELHSEVAYESGIEASVQIDAVSWQLGRLNATIPDDLEIEGIFGFTIVNLLQEAAVVRYELRFFDEDDLFVDTYFPFGQPVELGSGESRRLAGTFVVRLGDIEELRFVQNMRIVVQPAN